MTQVETRSQLPGPWLVADIGGTNARFGWVEGAGGKVTQVVSIPTAGHAGPAAAAALMPGSELAALAGAVLGLAAGWGAARAWLRRSPPRYRLRTAEAA